MLGKDKPQGAAWVRAALNPKPPPALLQPRAHSLELHPCSYPQEQSPEESLPSLNPVRGRCLSNECWQKGLPQPTGGLCGMPIPLSSLPMVKDKSRAEE